MTFKPVTRYLTAPDGTNYTTDNLVKFSQEHDLSYENMSQLCRHTVAHYRGWREGHNQGAFHRPVKKYTPHYQHCHFEVTAPDGTNHTITNMVEFCKEHDLKYRRMVLLVNGKSYRGREFHYKGWRVGHDMGEFDYLTPIDSYTVNRLVKLYPSCSVNQLAARFDISTSVVRKYLRKAGVYELSRQRCTKLDQEQIERVKQLSQTCTIQQISERYSISKATVRKYIHAS